LSRALANVKLDAMFAKGGNSQDVVKKVTSSGGGGHCCIKYSLSNGA
jgi:hypothetical protein